MITDTEYELNKLKRELDDLDSGLRQTARSIRESLRYLTERLDEHVIRIDHLEALLTELKRA